MHRIGFIKIKNFKLCKDVELDLEDFTPLVGQNNTGKSTILEAIAWVIKPLALKNDMFFDVNEPIEVIARIDGVSSGVLEKVKNEAHRKAIAPFCLNDSIWIRVVVPGGGGKLEQTVYDVEKYSGKGVPLEWRSYPTGLPQAVTTLFPEPLQIEAMHNIADDLGKVRAGSTIKRLLDEIMSPILTAHQGLNEALSKVQNILTKDGADRSETLADFDRNASEALQRFFPGLSLQLDLQILEPKDLFKAGDILVGDGGSSEQRRFDQMGAGAQRAIQMALIHYLATLHKQSESDVSKRLLLIDEPELYLHPQAIRHLRAALELLSKSGYQVVFSTHSPVMLSRDSAPNTVIVSKCFESGTKPHKPLKQAVLHAFKEAEVQSRTLFELGNLSEIYFSERVVLCEGKTDKRLLPLLYERVYGVPPEIDNIAFVPIGSCSSIPKAIPVLLSMGVKVSSVADLDFAFVDARKSSFLSKEDDCLAQAKEILKRLSEEHKFDLGPNGLPQHNKKDKFYAADAWALFAKDDEGRLVVQNVQEQLKEKKVWVWSAGCIEHVTGGSDKGEEAIINQEELFSSMPPEDVKANFPEVCDYFEWFRAM